MSTAAKAIGRMAGAYLQPIRNLIRLIIAVAFRVAGLSHGSHDVLRSRIEVWQTRAVWHVWKMDRAQRNSVSAAAPGNIAEPSTGTISAVALVLGANIHHMRAIELPMAPVSQIPWLNPSRTARFS